MSSPSDAAPDRSSAAGEETKRRLSRKRVTVITATALSLLEACGLEPSPARSEKTAGKGKKATQGEPPAEKASADGLEERQAAGSASSRERNGGRKKRSAPDRAPREAADAVPQEDASQGVAATKAALPEIPPVIPPAETTAAAVPPEPAIPPKKTTARRRRASGTKAAPVTDTGAVPATELAPAFGSVAQEASPPVVKPSAGQSAVEAAASVPGEDQPHSGARRRAVSRAGRASTSGGRGRKKAAATTPASAGEAGPTTAPVPEQQPAERPMDAAALAAEADRLAAEYGHRAAVWWCCPGTTGMIFPLLRIGKRRPLGRRLVVRRRSRPLLFLNPYRQRRPSLRRLLPLPPPKPHLRRQKAPPNVVVRAVRRLHLWPRTGRFPWPRLSHRWPHR